jgi:hypothetical protein
MTLDGFEPATLIEHRLISGYQSREPRQPGTIDQERIW